MQLVEVARCSSTQDEARDRARRDGGIVAVLAASQDSGRGRGQRTWQDAPDGSLLLSVARCEAVGTSVLDELPRRVADAVLRAVAAQSADLREALRWKAPNDLVAAADEAKLCGILVDARTVGSVVEEVVVGIGLNLRGAPFLTSDGRQATTLEALGGPAVPASTLAWDIAGRVARLLGD